MVRYKTCIERTFYRSLKELKALQTNAVIQATLPIQASPLCNAIEISKRTQHLDRKGELHQPPTTIHQPLTTIHQPLPPGQPPATIHQPPTTNHPPTTNQPPTSHHPPPFR
jgi:hypothetical protein